MFTGNRGCVVDDRENVVRHHGSSLWIICALTFKNYRWPLARPRRWTPLFFLDDAVALAAGHRPCATCRPADYTSYRDAVMRAEGLPKPPLASQLNDRLHAQRLRPGRGLARARDRKLWRADLGELPDGTVIANADDGCQLVLGDQLLRFSFAGWTDPVRRPPEGEANVITPPTSVAALTHGYRPVLHASAGPRD